MNSKSGKPGHPSRDICKRWCRDQPYIPVDDPEHPIPEEVAVNQRDMYTRMEAQIRASRERTAEAVARAHAEGDASTSDMIGSDDFSGAESTDSDEVIKEAEWHGLNVEKLGPVDPLDAMEVPDVPDRESLKAFLEAKADEEGYS